MFINYICIVCGLKKLNVYGRIIKDSKEKGWEYIMGHLKYIKPKLFSVMKSYSKEQFVKDVIAGIIVAIIALPLSIALAIASGVNPEQGLYTGIIAGFFISFLGGSRVQIGGPTAAFVVIIYGIIADHGINGLTVATLMAGVIMILMGIFKLGNLIKYIP